MQRRVSWDPSCRNGAATQLTTTAIYADAVGTEEKDIARRMWA